ncbi:MAG: Na(+)-translocating NADH-quinone reductase subunit C [Deltaproteobacteria bacterium]|nr:Na(+)-translocating NADH-quinone reductase subunit C [Deltaproteobacteria bacterium]HCH62115.1 Na(+)-translocating NADH-quinone reductase subunit C [Deltaproteobacteria bacterium]
MSQPSTGYTVGFAAGICLVASVFVSGAAVSLKPMQEANKVLDRQKKVLGVAGLMEKGEAITPDEIQKRFDENIIARLVSLESGLVVETADNGQTADEYDQLKATKDPALSIATPDNKAKVPRMAKLATVYCVKQDAGCDQHILPIEGKGLWSTMYGFVSVDSDANTIRGITFYQHGETPGLGGEIDNLDWQQKWVGRKVYNDKGSVAIHVKKGAAGKADVAPYSVDGLSGATLTSNGVTHSLDLWLGAQGFESYLSNVKSGKVKG